MKTMNFAGFLNREEKALRNKQNQEEGKLDGFFLIIRKAPVSCCRPKNFAAKTNQADWRAI